MNDSREDTELQRRLRAMAEHPVAPATAQRVLARAQAAPVSGLHSTRVKVGAALAAGFVAGSMGLASAGELPASVQDVAHDALGAVGIKVPPGHDRYNGPECGGTYANHGQYVRAHKEDPNAGSSPCGKPNKAVVGGGDAEEPEVEGADEQGPPPWSNGKGQGHGKDKDTKVKGGKGPGAGGGDGGDGAAESPAPALGEVTTTTAARTTATTTVATTTTTTTTTTPTPTPTTSTTTTPSTTTTSTSTPEPPATTTVP